METRNISCSTFWITTSRQLVTGDYELIRKVQLSISSYTSLRQKIKMKSSEEEPMNKLILTSSSVSTMFHSTNTSLPILIGIGKAVVNMTMDAVPDLSFPVSRERDRL